MWAARTVLWWLLLRGGVRGKTYPAGLGSMKALAQDDGFGLPGLCSLVCSTAQSLVSKVAMTSCIGSLVSFEPSLVCPVGLPNLFPMSLLLNPLFCQVSLVASSSFCHPICQEAEDRIGGLSPDTSFLPALAVVGSLASLYLSQGQKGQHQSGIWILSLLLQSLNLYILLQKLCH